MPHAPSSPPPSPMKRQHADISYFLYETPLPGGIDRSRCIGSMTGYFCLFSEQLQPTVCLGACIVTAGIKKPATVPIQPMTDRTGPEDFEHMVWGMIPMIQRYLGAGGQTNRPTSGTRVPGRHTVRFGILPLADPTRSPFFCILQNNVTFFYIPAWPAVMHYRRYFTEITGFGSSRQPNAGRMRGISR